jgi:hypothetical protein
MNNRLLVANQPAVGGLLDLVPGAAAAYSLRSLSNAYTDPVVTVRRSSDNAEDSFTATEVSDGTLAAFCGVGDGFVSEWRDQSGNGRHATQVTAASQPKIVSGGTIIGSDGKPAIQFETTNAAGSYIRLQTTAFSAAIPQPVTCFIACNQLATSDRQTPVDGRIDQFMFAADLGGGVYAMAADPAAVLDSTTPLRTGSALFSALFDTSSSNMRMNGAGIVSGTIGANSLDGITIGNIRGVSEPISGGYAWIGTISELIVYPSDQTANRELIEGNIAWSYS